MKILSLTILIIFNFTVWAQQTRVLPDGAQSPNARIENFAWIQGHWQGEALGGIVEEIWSAPGGKSMMCSFRLIKDGIVQFYELCVLREIGQTVVLELKHFDHELKGWETQNEKVIFPLVSFTKDKAFFEGFTIEKVDENHLDIYVLIGQEGEETEMLFSYARQLE